MWARAPLASLPGLAGPCGSHYLRAHLAWENIRLSDGVLKRKLHSCPASSFLPVLGIEQTHFTDRYNETWGFDEDGIVSNHPGYLLAASL